MSIMDAFGHDIEKAGQMQEILEYCQTPRTIEEVADEFEWHPQTAREKLWTLKDMGKIRESSRRKGRMKLWQSVGQLGDRGEVVVVTSSQSIPMSTFFDVVNTRRSSTNLLGQALSYLYRRAYYKQQDQENVLNVAKQGSLDPLLDVKQALMKMYLQHKLVGEALERMLLDMPELWQDGNPAILRMAGQVDRTLIEEQVGDFEEWCRQFLGR